MIVGDGGVRNYGEIGLPFVQYHGVAQDVQKREVERDEEVNGDAPLC